MPSSSNFNEPRISTQHDHVKPLLRPPDPELSLRAARSGTGNWTNRASRLSRSRRTRRRARVHHSDPETEEAKEDRPSRKAWCSTRGKGSQPKPSSTIPPRSSTRCAARRHMARLAQSQPVAGHARDGASAPALAASRVQRRSPVLLSGGSGRNRDLADRGCTQYQTRQATSRPPGERQQGCQPGVDAAGAQAGDRARAKPPSWPC